MKSLHTIAAVGATIALCACGSPKSTPESDSSECLTLIVGSYSAPGDSALRLYSFNTSDSSARLLGSLPVANASFAAITESGLIYALCESDSANSTVTALRLNDDKSGATVVNSQAVCSGAPCYIAQTPDNRFAVTANYTGGTAAVFSLQPDGSLGERSLLITFDGNGPVEGRQQAPHPHCIAFTPDKRFMLVDDLGSDRIWMFALDGDYLSPVASEPADAVVLEPGSGPRHIEFNSKGDRAYLINELSDKVTVLSYDGSKLEPIQYIEADSLGGHASADIHLSPDGRHLYASLRLKNDGVVTFDVDPQSGKLTYKSHTPTPGGPRNFTITPDGSLMLVACQSGNVVQIYAIDSESGIPVDTGKSISQPKAVFVRVL